MDVYWGEGGQIQERGRKQCGMRCDEGKAMGDTSAVIELVED
jgi:hypothetical protein